MVEKVCGGWVKKDIASCTSKADTKSNAANPPAHVCIVRSEPNQNLRNQWQDLTDKWDNEIQLAVLDELDRMSVELHRHLLHRVTDEDRKHVIYLASSMRAALKDFPEAAASFEELYSCMNDILKGVHTEKAQSVRDKVYMYEDVLLVNFKSKLAAVQECPAKTRAARCLREIESKDREFSRILESMRYTDFKQEDTVLIDNIPFILTYRTDVNLVVPFCNEVRDSTKFFNNAASALVINPRRIIYVSKCTDITESSFRKLTDFIAKRRLRAEIELLLIGTCFAFPGIKITHVDTVRAARDYVSSLDDGRTVLDRNGSTIFDRYPDRFDFDSASMSFMDACGFSATFGYLKKKPFITVHDACFFNMSGEPKSNPPEFFGDYSRLWELYTANLYAWKRMTQALGEYVKINDIIATFRIPQRLGEELTKRSYVLPFECR